MLPFCTVLAFLLRRLYNVSHAKKRRIFPMSNVSIKLLREGAKLPARGSAFAAGYDLAFYISIGLSDYLENHKSIVDEYAVAD